ncbi:hypothetical protein [Paenibacillus harenae]|uniref:hypothetical protein n=1 Tax=Paenibacillus harenae TaxID=306543 RepID=UPI0003F726EC|nr:hypothetical protein [Paenibacillus harenae]
MRKLIDEYGADTPILDAVRSQNINIRNRISLMICSARAASQHLGKRGELVWNVRDL